MSSSMTPFSFARPCNAQPKLKHPSQFLLLANAIDRPERTISTITTKTLSLSRLPLELIQKIFFECCDIKSVLNLSVTSRQLRAAFVGSQKLLIIENVLEIQFGPLHEIIQVITYNASQPAHTPRYPALSIALAQQIVRVGYVAHKWEKSYPLLRWRDQTEHRRVLRPHEAFRFRRAMYRLWLYVKAFCSHQYLEMDPSAPRASSKDRRLTFLRRFDDDEIMEITELNDILHDMIHNDLCPSDAIIQQRFKQGFPSQAPLYFGTYETHPVQCCCDSVCRRIVFKRDLPQNLVAEAWGPYYTQDRIVRNVLKLEPDQLLYFKEKLGNKAERVEYLATFPETFHRHQSTLRCAVDSVMVERDYSMGPNHGIDGGILDFLHEMPGERYEGSDYRGSSTSAGDLDEDDEDKDEDDSEEDEGLEPNEDA